MIISRRITHVNDIASLVEINQQQLNITVTQPSQVRHFNFYFHVTKSLIRDIVQVFIRCVSKKKFFVSTSFIKCFSERFLNSGLFADWREIAQYNGRKWKKWPTGNSVEERKILYKFLMTLKMWIKPGFDLICLFVNP